MEKTVESTISVPEAYRIILEGLRLLQRDGQNPNKMTAQQKEATWNSLNKFGWIYPIITNKDDLLTDGEQRIDVCLDHGVFFGPVLRLDVDDVTRRIQRQALNKLRGTHDKLLDAEEFRRIKDANGKETLKSTLAISDGTLERYDRLLDAADDERGAILDSSFEVVVKCKDEEEQERVFEELKGQGLDVRILTL